MQDMFNFLIHSILFLQKWFSVSGIQQYEGCTAQSIPLGQHMNPGGQSHRETSGSGSTCPAGSSRVFRNSATFIIPASSDFRENFLVLGTVNAVTAQSSETKSRSFIISSPMLRPLQSSTRYRIIWMYSPM